MSVGAIPFTSIDVYARRYGIESVDDFDRFRILIHRMDTAFLKYFADEAKAEEKRNKNGRNR
ncbi:MAG: hypothetical protein WC100_06960 [Sterolibacterium sp.]